MRISVDRLWPYEMRITQCGISPGTWSTFVKRSSEKFISEKWMGDSKRYPLPVWCLAREIKRYGGVVHPSPSWRWDGKRDIDIDDEAVTMFLLENYGALAQW